MLKREDLEGNGPLGSLEALTLRNAAPKLALACLEARKLCLLILVTEEETDRPQEIRRRAEDIRSLLFNELTVAGVEVE